MYRRIAIIGGKKSGKKTRIKPDQTITIGREDFCDIAIPEKKISRKHCRIYWDPRSNDVVIEDLGSMNGTLVNGLRIIKPTLLRDRDNIQIGSSLLEYQIPEGCEDIKTETTNPGGDISSFLEPTTSVPIDMLPEKSEAEMDAIEKQIADDQNITGGRLLSGKLDTIPLPDLLQFLESTKKTGHLVLSKKKVYFPPNPEREKEVGYGSLYIQRGELIAAKYLEKSNEDALYDLLHWEKGYFSLFPRIDFEFEPRIETPLRALLMEGLNRIDEERAQGLVNVDIFEVNQEAPLRSLKPDHLEIYQLVWKHKQLDKIMKNTELDENAVKQILENLIELEYIKKI